MPSKLVILNPLFERQAKLLAQKQEMIKKRLIEIEKEKAVLLQQAQALCEDIGAFEVGP